MEEKGVSSIVVIAIVVIIVAVVGGYYFLVRGEGPVAGVVTLQELNQDFDNTTLKFRSFDPGDIVQVQDTVENVRLVTRDELDEEVANFFETSYEIIFPVTLITMESAENLEGQWAFTVIALEGDRCGEYEIGQQATVSIHIENVLGMEIPREVLTGNMLWFWARFGGGRIPPNPPSVTLRITAKNVGGTITLTIEHYGGDPILITDIRLIADNSATTQYEADLKDLTAETLLTVGHSMEVSYPADLNTGDTIRVQLIHIPSSQKIYDRSGILVESTGGGAVPPGVTLSITAVENTENTSRVNLTIEHVGGDALALGGIKLIASTIGTDYESEPLYPNLTSQTSLTVGHSVTISYPYGEKCGGATITVKLIYMPTRQMLYSRSNILVESVGGGAIPPSATLNVTAKDNGNGFLKLTIEHSGGSSLTLSDIKIIVSKSDGTPIAENILTAFPDITGTLTVAHSITIYVPYGGPSKGTSVRVQLVHIPSNQKIYDRSGISVE